MRTGSFHRCWLCPFPVPAAAAAPAVILHAAAAILSAAAAAAAAARPHLIAQHETSVAAEGVALHWLRCCIYLNTQDPAACSISRGARRICCGGFCINSMCNGASTPCQQQCTASNCTSAMCKHLGKLMDCHALLLPCKMRHFVCALSHAAHLLPDNVFNAKSVQQLRFTCGVFEVAAAGLYGGEVPQLHMCISTMAAKGVEVTGAYQAHLVQ
jgi:hypothetical protein